MGYQWLLGHIAPRIMQVSWEKDRSGTGEVVLPVDLNLLRKKMQVRAPAMVLSVPLERHMLCMEGQ